MKIVRAKFGHHLFPWTSHKYIFSIREIFSYNLGFKKVLVRHFRVTKKAILKH